MSLTRIFVRDFQADVYLKGLESNPRATGGRGGGFYYGVCREVPDKNKGKAHIYPDVLVMGPIYVIQSIILKKSWIWAYSIILA